VRDIEVITGLEVARTVEISKAIGSPITIGVLLAHIVLRLAGNLRAVDQRGIGPDRELSTDLGTLVGRAVDADHVHVIFLELVEGHPVFFHLVAVRAVWRVEF
jgi:hypothetical protein